MPIPETLVEPAITVFTAGATVLGTAAIAIWRFRSNTRKRRDEVEDREGELRDDAIDRIAEIIEVVLVNVLDENGVDRDQLTDTIREKVSDRRLDEFGQNWHNEDSPCDRFETCLDKYERAYKKVGLSALDLLTISVLIVLASGSNPFSWAMDLAHGVIGLHAAASLYAGIVAFNGAQSLKDDLL